MYRIILFVTLVLCGFEGFAQPYNNEWIDPAKTYYKFPVRSTQLCRIPKATLDSYGLGNIPAEQFQLWCDGQEVPVYTTEATGPIATNGFIEFLGRMNDGLKDSVLYPEKWFQPNASRSLFSDTTWYFLTVNPAGNNKRLIQTANNVATTTLPADSFFNYTAEMLFPQGYSQGYGVFISRRIDTIPIDRDLEPGEILRSSVFDQGEGWYYADFRKTAPATINLSNLNIYKGASSISLAYKASGYNSIDRNVMVYMNDSLINTANVVRFEMANQQIQNIPLSRITNNGNNTSLRFTTDRDDPYFWLPDHVFLHSIVLSYQHTFRLNHNLYGNLSYFDFNLNANPNGNHLRIATFRNDGLAPVLYDYSNLKRYTGQIKTDTSMFLLEPSLVDRNLVIISQHASRILNISSLKEVHFTNYAQVSNQANYLIVSSKLLYDYNGHNYVEDYRAYRSSLAGGSYNAKIFDIDELADQFAFGIRKHPLAVKNFIHYAHDKFNAQPKAIFLIGKATSYIDYKVSPYVGKDLLNIVPTYGLPASDNLLASANNMHMTPIIPIGRLSAVNGGEVSVYLQKVKEFEALNNFADNTVENKEWKKEVLQLNGVNDPYFSLAFSKTWFYISSKTLSDTFLGARVKTYAKLNNPNFALDMLTIANRINQGVGYINYFGESATSSLNFALDNPTDYQNTNGKYPIITALGCFAGNMFDFDGVRLGYSGLTASERYIFSAKRGAIAFVSNSSFGNFNYLYNYLSAWSTSLAKTKFGKSLGEIFQEAIDQTINITPTLVDYWNRANCEQLIFHGDPAIVMNPIPKPDYVLTDSLITVQPISRTVAEDSLLVKVRFYNIGAVKTDSVDIEFKREFPDGRTEILSKKKVPMVLRIKDSDNTYDSLITSLVEDSISIKTKLKGIFEKGTNYIIATIDPDNLQDEISESNNSGKFAFEVTDEEIRPVYPYNYAIVNQPGFLLTGSTVNAVQDVRTYRLQIDTTEAFNSPLLFQTDTTSLGGAVNFDPSVNWTNGRVYYWRLAPVINGQPVNWRSASFQYLQGPDAGFGQSHFYQHLHSDFDKISLDTDRLLHFKHSVQSLFIRNSIYGFSGGEDNHFSIAVNGELSIRSACVGRSIIFNVFDTLTFKPWENWSGYRFGSGPNCNYYREYNFEFSYVGSANRKLMMDFLDSIPKGLYVTARVILNGDYYSNGVTYFDSSFVKYWQRDTLIFGPGKSLYHSFLNQGFYTIDSINQPRAYLFVFKKDDSTNFKPIARVSDGLYDRVEKSVFPETIDSLGSITSPVFGPAKSWKQMHWMGHQFPGIDPESEALVEIIGIDKDSNETVLKTYTPSQWVNDISDVSAVQYPYLKLKLTTKNAVKAIPYQLDYWRLFYEPVPDGALSARDHYVFQAPVLLTAKDSLKIELAFKNVSRTFLDSTHAVIKLGDRNSIIATYDLGKLKPLQPQDTAIIYFKKATAGMSGKYYALIEVNKEQNPLEQFDFNNFTYLPFEVVTALPNTLVDFNARASQKTSVLLNWKASNETDVKSYDLEHGASVQELKFLHESTAINSGGDATYNWEHLSPIIGKNFYRLKITHQSGQVEYSPVRQVNFGRNITISAYPNPFTNQILVTANSNDKWIAELFNAAGQKLLSKNGSGNQYINTQALPVGSYLLRLTTGSETISVKLEKKGH